MKLKTSHIYNPSTLTQIIILALLGISISLICFTSYYIMTNERKFSALEERMEAVEKELTQIAENLELVYEVFGEAQKIKNHIQTRSRIQSEQIAEISYAILYSARATKINPFLLLAVAETESSFYPNAVGGVGERGLIQVCYGTFKMFSNGDFYNWRDTLQAGAKFLDYLLKRFKGNTILALAGYNAGPNRTRERMLELASPYLKKMERNYSRIAQNKEYANLIYSKDLKNAGWAGIKA